MIEQTPTLLRAIRTVPSSVSPVAKAISSNAESFVRAEVGAPDDFSMVLVPCELLLLADDCEITQRRGVAHSVPCVGIRN